MPEQGCRSRRRSLYNFVATLGINLFGDGLRGVLDPHRVLTSTAASRTE